MRNLGAQGSRQIAVPGPQDILRRILPNGVRVLARENWSAPSVVIDGYLLAGSLDEPSVLTGLTSFTSSMLSRGTRKRSFAEISEAVEAVGAAISFGADRYVTTFSTKSLAEDLDLVLAILRDELREPVFPAEHVEKVRGMRMTALAERENNTRQMANLTFRELVYPNHPLGRTLLGSRETNRQISRDAIVEFYETYYAPAGMVIVVVGAVKAEDAVARVEAVFGDWTGQRPPRREIPAVTRPASIVQRHIPMPDKSQTDLILGWPSMRRLDPDYEAARLANTVLGVFGLSGRLGLNVRERQGMAYSAYSQISADKLPGVWALIAGVNPANVVRAVESMLHEADRICQEPVAADELEDSKRYLTGSLPLQLETNDGVSGIISDMEWHGLGLDYVQRYLDMIAGLTADQVQAAAQKYLNTQAYVLAIAGP
ncbi:MAG TPA: pitrilysin family protein [Anaerolineae bacterium]